MSSSEKTLTTNEKDLSRWEKIRDSDDPGKNLLLFGLIYMVIPLGVSFFVHSPVLAEMKNWIEDRMLTEVLSLILAFAVAFALGALISKLFKFNFFFR